MPTERISPPTATGRIGGVMLLTLTLLLSACGTAEPEDGDQTASTEVDDGPRVADPRFDGDFLITELLLDGQPVDLSPPPIVSIETRFGGLTVNPGCNTYFGSFSLEEDGAASFTVAGGSDQDCGSEADQEAAVLAALAATESWQQSDGGFRLDGQDGASLTIVPA